MKKRWAVALWLPLMLLPASALALTEGTNITIQNGAVSVSGTIAVGLGGTGATTLTDGSVLLGAATSPVEFAAPGAAGEVLISAGVGVNPAFGAVDLADTDAVTGTLPFGNGGTGLATATEDAAMVGAGGSGWEAKVIPDCQDSGGNHLNYNNTTNAFSCGTTGPAGGDPVLSFSTLGDVTQGTTVHMGSSGNVDASQSRAQVIAAGAFTLDNLSCVASVAPGGADTIVITLADGACTGALSDSTAAVCTISASGRSCTDTGSEAITSGECFALGAVWSATAATSVVSCTMERTG
jgi:hypothetical protein